MSAGLPLLILTILSVNILMIWSFLGTGNKKIRILITISIFTLIAVSWFLIQHFGVFHPVGSSAMGFAFIISMGAVFIPIVFNKFSN